jgi:hypothetical protein
VSAGGATAADFEQATAELRALAEEVRDHSSLMIAVGLGTTEDDQAYLEAQHALKDIAAMETRLRRVEAERPRLSPDQL